MSGSTSPSGVARKFSSTKITKQLSVSFHLIYIKILLYLCIYFYLIIYLPQDLRSYDIMDMVVNKVGGIYTVLRTKAPVSTEELGDQYCMMGPLNEDRVKLEVEVLEPDHTAVKYALEQSRECGFKVFVDNLFSN
uniref:Glycogen [starch] synthase n=1 Tax=Heterorhabditis bacteriophora TaxID=37862 RepID=A0A1I7X7U6_HETBA